MIEAFFDKISTIAVHGQYRRVSFGLERFSYAKTSWYRLSSLRIGFIVTDSLFASSYDPSKYGPTRLGKTTTFDALL